MYNDRTSDWLFACTYTDLQPGRIAGTIKHKNKNLIDGIVFAGGKEIWYSKPKRDENGMWYTTWAYDIFVRVDIDKWGH